MLGWQLWQHCHFRHICQIRQYRQLLWAPSFLCVLCLVGKCGEIVIFATIAKFASIANFYEPPHCFVLCLVGKCAKIVIFAIFSKFASIANFYGSLIALCFALLSIVAILSFSPYLLNSSGSPTFMGPSLLCALPCWRLWQYCHFGHIC